MQARNPLSPALHTAPARQLRRRLDAMMDIASLDVACLVHATERRFEDRVRFGPAGMMQQNGESAAKFLAREVETALTDARLSPWCVRPVHVTAPQSALFDPQTAERCERAVANSGGCPQEVCLDFEDCAFAARPSDSYEAVRALRRRGFRVGVDARRAWASHTSAPLLMLLDLAHVRADTLLAEDDLAGRVRRAADAGVAVCAHAGRWQDAETLSKMGVRYLLRPACDA